jgi:hypothetical protein
MVLSCRTGFTFLLDEKSKQKNQVKNNLGVFSMDCHSPIDGFLTCPHGGYVRRGSNVWRVWCVDGRVRRGLTTRITVCCSSFVSGAETELPPSDFRLLTSRSWLFAPCSLPFASCFPLLARSPWLAAHDISFPPTAFRDLFSLPCVSFKSFAWIAIAFCVNCDRVLRELWSRFAWVAIAFCVNYFLRFFLAT